MITNTIQERNNFVELKCIYIYNINPGLQYFSITIFDSMLLTISAVLVRKLILYVLSLCTSPKRIRTYFFLLELTDTPTFLSNSKLYNEENELFRIF